MRNLHIKTKRKSTEQTRKNGIKKVLVIDSSNDSALSAALSQEGYDLIPCNSVQNAWTLIYPQRHHLIIINLHNLSEADLADLQECRALAGGVPIILATSAHVNEGLMKALQHWTAAILDLPSKPEIIREAIHDLQCST
jgi:DNA-binding NtrC family response regulator